MLSNASSQQHIGAVEEEGGTRLPQEAFVLETTTIHLWGFKTTDWLVTLKGYSLK